MDTSTEQKTHVGVKSEDVSDGEEEAYIRMIHEYRPFTRDKEHLLKIRDSRKMKQETVVHNIPQEFRFLLKKLDTTRDNASGETNVLLEENQLSVPPDSIVEKYESTSLEHKSHPDLSDERKVNMESALKHHIQKMYSSSDHKSPMNENIGDVSDGEEQEYIRMIHEYKPFTRDKEHLLKIRDSRKMNLEAVFHNIPKEFCFLLKQWDTTRDNASGETNLLLEENQLSVLPDSIVEKYESTSLEHKSHPDLSDERKVNMESPALKHHIQKMYSSSDHKSPMNENLGDVSDGEEQEYIRMIHEYQPFTRNKEHLLKIRDSRKMNQETVFNSIPKEFCFLLKKWGTTGENASGETKLPSEENQVTEPPNSVVQQYETTSVVRKSHQDLSDKQKVNMESALKRQIQKMNASSDHKSRMNEKIGDVSDGEEEEYLRMINQYQPFTRDRDLLLKLRGSLKVGMKKWTYEFPRECWPLIKEWVPILVFKKDDEVSEPRSPIWKCEHTEPQTPDETRDSSFTSNIEIAKNYLPDLEAQSKCKQWLDKYISGPYGETFCPRNEDQWSDKTILSPRCQSPISDTPIHMLDEETQNGLTRAIFRMAKQYRAMRKPLFEENLLTIRAQFPNVDILEYIHQHIPFCIHSIVEHLYGNQFYHEYIFLC